MVTDITGRKRAEDQLRRSADRLAMLHDMDQAFCVQGCKSANIAQLNHRDKPLVRDSRTEYVVKPEAKKSRQRCSSGPPGHGATMRPFDSASIPGDCAIIPAFARTNSRAFGSGGCGFGPGPPSFACVIHAS